MNMYREKKDVFEAIKFDGENFDEVCDFMGCTPEQDINPEYKGQEGVPYLLGIIFNTPAGPHEAEVGDWIIKGKEGFHACEADFFENRYELVGCASGEEYDVKLCEAELVDIDNALWTLLHESHEEWVADRLERLRDRLLAMRKGWE